MAFLGSIYTLEADGGVHIPNQIGGVYEARIINSQERLSIARSGDLRWAIREEVVRRSPHSTSALGRKIRENEDASNVDIRWMVTEHHKLMKECLCRQHIEKFGHMPKYTTRI